VRYPLTAIAGLEDDALVALKAAGIRSTGSLLENTRTAAQRKQLAATTGLDPRKLLCWANLADRMRVKGISKEYAELLSAAGVETVKDLKVRNPANLAKAMASANKARKLVRLLPSERVVTRWIENAKELPLKIRY
jgi:Domain of unknown function (DUF4332)